MYLIRRGLSTRKNASEIAQDLVAPAKVFLVDRDGGVRNVYRAGFLVPARVVNDIRTVLGHGPARESEDVEQGTRAQRVRLPEAAGA